MGFCPTYCNIFARGLTLWSHDPLDLGEKKAENAQKMMKMRICQKGQKMRKMRKNAQINAERDPPCAVIDKGVGRQVCTIKGGGRMIKNSLNVEEYPKPLPVNVLPLIRRQFRRPYETRVPPHQV